MKKVITDRDLLMRYLSSEDDLNRVQYSYLIKSKLIFRDGSLTEKGIELAYGESTAKDSTILPN